MRVNQPPVIIGPSSVANSSIQGDAAARRFGIFFLSTLAVVTIGAGVGIGVGNIAHYRYFSPNNLTNITSAQLYNLSSRALPININIPLLSPLIQHLKRRESSPLTMSVETFPAKDEDNRP